MISHNILQADETIADADLETRVRVALAMRLGPTFKRLSVEARSGGVTLRGRVLTFYEKQLGAAAALRVPGVIAVIDAVEVIAASRARA